MEKIKEGLKFDTEKLGIQVSNEAIEFIQNCLTFEPENRLGTAQGKNILEHPWFSSINQDELLSKEFEFSEENRPKLDEDGIDLKYFDDVASKQSGKESLIGRAAREIIKGK